MLLQHPHFGGLVRFAVTRLGDLPDDRVAQTIRIMQRYVIEDADTDTLHAAAARALAEAPGADLLTAAWRYAKRHVRFVLDERAAAALPELGGQVVEVLVRPIDMVTEINRQGIGYGDCDDFSMLVAALLRVWNIPASFATVAADYEFPTQYSHVYVLAHPQPGVTFALDASHGAYAG